VVDNSNVSGLLVVLCADLRDKQRTAKPGPSARVDQLALVKMRLRITRQMQTQNVSNDQCAVVPQASDI
jgi:hypothetical protein